KYGLRGLEPARAGHRAVHHDDGGAQFEREADGLFTIARLSRDADGRIVLQEPAEAPPHQRVIVDEQNGDGVCHAAAPVPTGTLKRTSVPPPGGSRNSIVPPSSSARSRIATSPSPRAPSGGARPLP